MEVSIANPRARFIEFDDAVWIASGLTAHDSECLAREPSDERAAALCRQVGDATVIRLTRPAGQFRALTAWKGLTSCHEVFFRVGGGAETIVADHFRNALAHVPPHERLPSDEALCDHFLFRTVPADGTLCQSIRRLGRGERLDLDLSRGRMHRRLFDRVHEPVRPATTDVYLDRIDAALDEVLAPWCGHQGAVNLFSGGVDSTLIHTYLRNGVPAISYHLPHYADSFEAGYVDHAAGLLGLRLERREADMAGYLENLERLIADTGLPPPHVQLVLYQDLFAARHRDFLIGDQADAVFGIGLRNLRLASPFRSPVGRLLLGTAGRLVPGRPRQRLLRLHELATELAHPEGSIDGYAGRFGVYADLPLVERLFGRSRIDDRLRARLGRVLERIEPCGKGGDRFFAQLETAQMVDFLAEDIMMCFRHLAFAHGKSVTSPFMTGPLLRAALSVPAQERYLRGLQGKYLPKLLLARRLPQYPVDQPKGYSHISLDALQSGALREVWDRYPIPEPFDHRRDEASLRAPSPTTWNAVTLAIWQQHVRNHAHLEPVPHTRRITSDVAPANP